MNVKKYLNKKKSNHRFLKWETVQVNFNVKD